MSVLCCLLCVSEYGASVWLSVVLAAQCSSNSLLHTYSPLCAVYHERWAHLFHLVESLPCLNPFPFPVAFRHPLFIPGPRTFFPCRCATNKPEILSYSNQSLAQDLLIISRVYKDTKPPRFLHCHFFILACSACALAFVLAACHHTPDADLLRRFGSLSSLKLSLPAKDSPFLGSQEKTLPFDITTTLLYSLFSCSPFIFVRAPFNFPSRFSYIAAAFQQNNRFQGPFVARPAGLFLPRLAGNSSIRGLISRFEWAASTIGALTRETAPWIDLPAFAGPGASRRLAPWVVQCPSCPTCLKCPSPSFSVPAGISTRPRPGAVSRLDALTTIGLTARLTIWESQPDPRPNRRPSAEAGPPVPTRASGLSGDAPLVSCRLCISVALDSMIQILSIRSDSLSIVLRSFSLQSPGPFCLERQFSSPSSSHSLRIRSPLLASSSGRLLRFCSRVAVQYDGRVGDFVASSLVMSRGLSNPPATSTLEDDASSQSTKITSHGRSPVA